jgi:hypothetical protein
MTQRRAAAILLLTSAISSTGCLPADTRPEPGRVYVTADLPADLRESAQSDGKPSFATDDGWTITLDRLFAAVGGLGFARHDACIEYSEADYNRILDLRQPGPQKIGQIWGLNDCLLSYSILVPDAEAVLGVGVTAEDRALMANAVVPVSSPTAVTTAQGMAFYVEGNAEKDGMLVRFKWGFSDSIDWTDCQRLFDGELEARLPLKGGETISVNITVDPRNLFRAILPDARPTAAPDAGVAPAAALPLMQLIADADQVNGDANGRVSVDELATVAVSGIGNTGSQNLAEILRLRSYPSVFVYADDGQCVLDTHERRGPGGHM